MEGYRYYDDQYFFDFLKAAATFRIQDFVSIQFWQCLEKAGTHLDLFLLGQLAIKAKAYTPDDLLGVIELLKEQCL